jgi:hypothetical protein
MIVATGLPPAKRGTAQALRKTKNLSMIEVEPGACGLRSLLVRSQSCPVFLFLGSFQNSLQTYSYAESTSPPIVWQVETIFVP